jgi:hypothetical protein
LRLNIDPDDLRQALRQPHFSWLTVSSQVQIGSCLPSLGHSYCYSYSQYQSRKQKASRVVNVTETRTQCHRRYVVRVSSSLSCLAVSACRLQLHVVARKTHHVRTPSKRTRRKTSRDGSSPDVVRGKTRGRFLREPRVETLGTGDPPSSRRRRRHKSVVSDPASTPLDSRIVQVSPPLVLCRSF